MSQGAAAQPEREVVSLLEEREWRFPWQRSFLESLTLNPSVANACQRAGISGVRPYQVRDADPLFAEAWVEARKLGVEALARLAWRSATTGEPRRVTRTRVTRDAEGKVTERVEWVEESAEVDQSMRRWLLSRYDPEQYGDRVEHRHAGPDGGPIKIEHGRYNDAVERLNARVVELADTRRARELPPGGSGAGGDAG